MLNNHAKAVLKLGLRCMSMWIEWAFVDNVVSVTSEFWERVLFFGWWCSLAFAVFLSFWLLVGLIILIADGATVPDAAPDPG